MIHINLYSDNQASSDTGTLIEHAFDGTELSRTISSGEAPLTRRFANLSGVAALRLSHSTAKLDGEGSIAAMFRPFGSSGAFAPLGPTVTVSRTGDVEDSGLMPIDPAATVSTGVELCVATGVEGGSAAFVSINLTD